MYFPKGTYHLTQSINMHAAAGPTYLRGASMEATILTWRTNVDGIVGNFGFNDYYVKTPARISDLTVASESNNGATTKAGILLTFAGSPGGGPISISAQTGRISDVVVRTNPEVLEQGPTTGWGTAISLNNAWNTHINDVVIQYPIQYGIRMTGQSNDVAMSRIKIFGRGNVGSTGIAVQGDPRDPLSTIRR